MKKMISKLKKIDTAIKKPVKSILAVLLTVSVLSNGLFIHSENTNAQDLTSPNSLSSDYIAPEILNAQTSEVLDPEKTGYRPTIKLGVKFGEGENQSIGKDINMPTKNKVNLPNVADGCKFVKAIVVSDKENGGRTVDQNNGKNYIKEVEKVIKIDNAYYALIKGSKQDYLKLTNPKQLKLIYDRYLRVGFKKSESASNYLDSIQIMSGYTPVIPPGVTDEQFREGFYEKGTNYVDGKMYYVPDYKSIKFSRP